jgi:hypothetical protein
MPTKTTAKRLAKEEEIRQLENQIKQLKQQEKAEERKERTHRICKRGGYIESRLPEIAALTDEQFKALLEKTLFGEYARKLLDKLNTENGETAADKPAGAERGGGSDGTESGGKVTTGQAVNAPENENEEAEYAQA